MSSNILCKLKQGSMPQFPQPLRALQEDNWCYPWGHTLSCWKWDQGYGKKVFLDLSSVTLIRNCSGCQQLPLLDFLSMN